MRKRGAFSAGVVGLPAIALGIGVGVGVGVDIVIGIYRGGVTRGPWHNRVDAGGPMHAAPALERDTT